MTEPPATTPRPTPVRVSPVRASRDGDQLHYLWAARRCLLLLAPTTDLVAIAIEGASVISEELKLAGQRARRLSVHFRRVLLVSAGHFVVTLLLAAVAFGCDMDQLRSRSAWSRGTAAIHDVLWCPHDAALRALPNDRLARNKYVIPVALLLNSLAWGTIPYSFWRASRRLGRVAT